MTAEECLYLENSMRGAVLLNEPMSRHTSLKVGGPADCFAIPADLDDLHRLVAFLDKDSIPYLVVGGGYNLLIRDGGFRGVIISLEELSRLEYTPENLIVAEAGAANGALVHFAMENGLAGLEFLVGIPGRLGGALAMNAGAEGRTVTDSLETLTTLLHGVVTVKRKEELTRGYRFLQLAHDEIILGASFRLEKEDRNIIAARIEATRNYRRTTQQVGYPNAGSFFRNPPEKPAWRLIDEAGLRGCCVGGAQVSEVHANFLVNRGEAKAADFIRLAEHVKKVVKERTGITLREEVRIAGTDYSTTERYEK